MEPVPARPPAPPPTPVPRLGTLPEAAPARAVTGGGSGAPDDAKPETSGKAVAAAICPIVAGPVGAIPAVVLAIMALKDISAHPGRGGRSLAMIGLVVGGVQVLIMAAILVPLMFGGSGSVSPEGVVPIANDSIHGDGPTSSIRVHHARQAIQNVQRLEANGVRCAAEGSCTVDAIAADVSGMFGGTVASGAAALPLMGVRAEATNGGAGFRISAVAEGEGVTFTSAGPSHHTCAPIDAELCPKGTW